MILALIASLLCVLIGFFIAYLSRDELIVGRKWFRVVFIVFFVLGLAYFIYGMRIEGLASFDISIVALISYIKSFDKKWTSKRID